jgi:hypothetical protein
MPRRPPAGKPKSPRNPRGAGISTFREPNLLRSKGAVPPERLLPLRAGYLAEHRLIAGVFVCRRALTERSKGNCPPPRTERCAGNDSADRLTSDPLRHPPRLPRG